MRVFAVPCFVCLLAAAPLAAGTFSWTHLPFIEAETLPGRAMLTSDPAISYAVSPGGAHRSDDGGRHWRKLEAPVGVVDLAVDPRDPETIFTDVYGQLLRSADGGASWQVVLQNPRNGLPLGVLPSRQEGRVYAASAESIWESEDGGQTFVRRGAVPDAGTWPYRTLVEAADGGLYLHSRASCGHHGCGPGWRIDRSADQGRTWTRVDGGETVNPVNEVYPHPVEPAGVYLLRQNAINDQDLLYSADRGATFTHRSKSPGGGSLVAGADLPETLLMVGRYHVWRSDDGGRHWTELPVPIDLGTNGDAVIYFYPPRRLLVHLTDYAAPRPPDPSVYTSSDRGASWAPLEVEGLLSQSISLAAASGPGPSLYLESQGMLARSHDGGETWVNFLAPRVIVDLVGDPVDGNTVYAVGYLNQDSGILRSRDGGESFQLVLDDDPSFLGAPDLVAFRRGDATTLLAAMPNGMLARSSDGGDTWQVAPMVLVGSLGSGPQLGRLVESSGVVYGVPPYFGPVYRSADGGVSFVRLEIQSSDNLVGGGGMIADLDGSANAVRVGYGGPWQSNPLPFPLTGDTRLHADPYGNLYLLGRGFFLRSRDQGRSWQSLSQGLPETSTRSTLLFDPFVRDRLYLATSAGFYAGDFAGAPPLALVRGRFEARVRWRLGPAFPWTEGAAASISDQTGVFRFFSPERAEIAVQILDGRVLSGRFWTFVASMTDVEVEVEVEDRQTGDTWRHHQPAGGMASTANFGAFPRQYQPTAGALPHPFGGFAAPAGTVLLAGRFEVSASRPAPYAFPPEGRQLFGDTAGFTFFDPAAMDLVVNLIDGRAINGKWWVFAGSLTDQEYVLTVRDVVTGRVKFYPNPAGGFAGFGDTDAF